MDQLFRRFDEIVDRHGLEKIKTIGDAYMAVAGAPVPLANHAAAAVAAAMDMAAEAREILWPSGEPVQVRTGVASGPVVAGVIGQRKFAYDLWGDTVNLASRLQSHGEPRRILASESVAAHLEGRYEFGPPLLMDLKGKGPTEARFLLSRDGASYGDQEPPPTEPAVDREVAGLVGDPSRVRMGRGPGDVDSPGGELEEEQHVERLQRDGLDREEVAGQDACRLGAEELVPRRSVPAGSWVQVVAKEGCAHGGG